MIRLSVTFCLQLVSDLHTRAYIVEKLIPTHAHDELRKFVAYKILEQFLIRESCEPESGASSSTPDVSTMPTARDVYVLVSRPDFPLISGNRWQKRQFQSVQLKQLHVLLQLIQAAVGAIHLVALQDKVLVHIFHFALLIFSCSSQN